MSGVAINPGVIGRHGAAGCGGRLAGVRQVAAARSAGSVSNRSSDGAVTPIRVTARGRRAVAVLALVLAAGVGLVGGRASAASPQESERVEHVLVASGDTLWSLASAVAEPGVDLRDVVQHIQRLNGLSTAQLRAGDVIVVPAG